MNDITEEQDPFRSDEDPEMSWWERTAAFAWELFKVVLISIAVIVPIRYFLIQPFYVRGASMEPNFFDHEYLVIDEVSYGLRVPFTEIVFPFGDPIRGEIVVFRYPRDPRQFFIKRIIGLPGETVMIRDGVVTIIDRAHPEGVALREPYLADTVTTRGDATVTLDTREYFVMGDNREASLDSRSFGAVERHDIVGRTWVRGWPFDRMMVFRAPSYNL